MGVTTHTRAAKCGDCKFCKGFKDGNPHIISENFKWVPNSYIGITLNYWLWYATKI